jgi:hypothetical protein
MLMRLQLLTGADPKGTCLERRRSTQTGGASPVQSGLEDRDKVRRNLAPRVATGYAIQRLHLNAMPLPLRRPPRRHIVNRKTEGT